MDEISVLGEIEEKELQKIKIVMIDLYSIWNEIGIAKHLKIERVKTAWSHILNLAKDIYHEEVAVFEELKNRIKDYTEKVSYLAKNLSVEVPDVAGLTLLEREEVLRKEYNKLFELKEKRIKEVKDLKDSEHHYRLLLEVEEYHFSFNTDIPSVISIEELRHHVNKLAEEYNTRYARYCEAKEQFISIIEGSELCPETPLEIDLYSGKDPNSLSLGTLRAIDEVLDKAKKKISDIENQKQLLMNKLNTLWERLNVGNDLKLDFLSSHLDCKATTLKSIQEELERCEEIRRQNIRSFIESVRKELSNWWAKCGASESEKQSFHFYYSTEETEDVLIAHEKEVEKWKSYYEEVKTILQKIEQRCKLWELLTDLDKKANDPSRFKNRGGSLLAEERERNKLQKKLPALEKEISLGIEKYEKETGKKFLYLGEDYISHISKQWEERQITKLGDKENMKLDKLQQCTTPLKRPQFATPKSAPCPRLRRYGTPLTTAGSKSVKKTFPKPNVIKKRDMDVLKEINKKRENVPCDDTTYSTFANELNKTARRSFRSSVVVSKKIGGTRTSNSLKKKNKASAKTLRTPDKNHSDLVLARGKAGLPFVM